MAKRTQKKDVSSKNLITIILIVAAAFLISGNGLTGAFSWDNIFGTRYVPSVPPQPVVVSQPTTTETMLPSTTDASSPITYGTIEISVPHLSELLNKKEDLDIITSITEEDRETALDTISAAGTNLYCLCQDPTKNGCLKPKVACKDLDGTNYDKNDVPEKGGVKAVEDHCLWKCGGAPILVKGGIAFSGC